MRVSIRDILVVAAASAFAWVGGVGGCVTGPGNYPTTPPVRSKPVVAGSDRPVSPVSDPAPTPNPLGSGGGSAGTVPPPNTVPPVSSPGPGAAVSTPDNPMAGAQVLCDGPYPPPSFPAPSQPGQLIVVDDANPTVSIAKTVVTGADSGKMMSITDVPGIAADLDKTHKYSVIFVPLKSGNP